jgi:predicted esterase
MRILLLVGILIFHFSSLQAQRYFEPIFNEVLEDSLVYAIGNDYLGNKQELKLDIYEPKDDAASNRPLILFFHGGGFLFGNKREEELVYWAKSMAKRGYICMSVQYRLGIETSNFFNINPEVAKAVWRATLDARAAVQYAKANATKHRIDTTQIFLTGVSAGAIASIHSQMLDTDVEFSQSSPRINPAGTGLTVPDEYLSYNFRVKGILNLCGAIGNLNWMRNNTNYHLLNIHGDQDPTIPYKTGAFRVGPLNITTLSGSFSIDSMAKVLGIKSQLHTFKGMGHVPFSPRGTNASNSKFYIDSVEVLIRDFLFPLVDENSVSIDETNFEQAITIFPNPAQDWIMVQNKYVSNIEIEIKDLMGKNLDSFLSNELNTKIPLNNYKDGVYMLRIFDKNLKMSINYLFLKK